VSHQKVIGNFPTGEVVYFVRYGRIVKIGFSTNFAQRLAELQRGTPESLFVLGVYPGGRDLERKFHTLFASLKIKNEFFRYDDPLWRFVEIAETHSIAKAIEYVEERNAWSQKSRSERAAILYWKQREERSKAIAAKLIVTIYPEDWNNARLEANRLKVSKPGAAQ
jgi:hypothetical protein